MECPYCGGEMAKGILSGDGRSTVRWKPGEKKADIWDTLSFAGRVTAAEYHRLKAAFTMTAYFCPRCRKMVIDTDVEKNGL